MIRKILIFLSILSLSYSKIYQMQDSFNEFGISLFKKINSQSNSNFMISPISISHALMMVNYGASGKTHNEILSVLNLDHSYVTNYFKLYNQPNSIFQINNKN